MMNISKLTFESLNVLVVDDNTASRIIAVGFLKYFGISAQAAESGADAIQMVKESTFDFILMDCQMPEMDGYEATVKIRKLMLSKTPVIIALSATNGSKEISECFAAGMDDYLIQPLSKKSLKEKLSNWMLAETPDLIVEGEIDKVEQMKSESFKFLDVDYLLNHYCGGETVLFDLARIFMDSAPDHINDLEQMIERSDHQAIQKRIHVIKGIFSSLYSEQINLLIEDLECAFRKYDPESWKTALVPIKANLDTILKEVECLLNHESLSKSA